ncbi:MAG: hypothetical protein N3E39_00980 [Candidatus Methanomethylicia archaeon]|nr:hypothetical protein [Candidatus Methanomethylicia archaeon]MDW7988521.1 FtsX-like permease family protein [Nitrososphaerota archaeon]
MGLRKYAIIMIILAISIFFTIQTVYSEVTYDVTIRVCDVNGRNIHNSKIYIYRQTYTRTQTFYNKYTLEYGYKTISLPQGTYIIYAKADLPETEILDYVIGYRVVEVNRNIEVVLTLMDAAEIRVIGECLDARSETKGKVMGYVVKADIEMKIDETNVLIEFGDRAGSLALEMESNVIVIPANVNVIVEIEVLYSTGAGRYVYTKYYNLTEKPICLVKGSSITLELQEITLKKSIMEVSIELSEVINMIDEAERDGFYLAMYRSRIPRVNSLIYHGENALKIMKFDECYSSIREALLILKDIKSKISQLYLEAFGSAITIIVLLAFTSNAIGLTLFDKEKYSVITSIVSFVALILLFKNLYPGINALNQEFLNMYAIALYIMALMITLLPNRIGGRREASLWGLISSIASIAKRNMKRRKLRSTLTIISIIIIIGGFIALTSISMEEGLKISKLAKTKDVEGIVVYRGGDEREYSKFTALSTMIIEAYSLDVKASRYSFKLESQAKLTPIDIGINPYSPEKLVIYGVIAFTDPLDPIINEINMKINGRMPRGKGEIAILESAASKLNVNVGDSIILLNSGLKMKITGILKDDFVSIVDYDDRNLRPGKLVMVIGGEEVRIELMDCEPNEIILVSVEDASIFSLIPARLYVEISGEEAISISKRIALSGIYTVKTILKEATYIMQYQKYMEIKGLEAMLTLAICISNICIVMLASVYERKNEVMILSAIGLNPGHITAIFAFEAITIGLLAGGFGYILGLSFYKLAYNLNLIIEVYPKVSSSWAISTIVISVLTAISGAIPALKSSVIVTPSKLMRWKADYKPEDPEKPWEFMIPIRLNENEVNSMIKYIERELSTTTGVERLKLIDDKNIKFSYRIGQGSIGSSGSINHLQVYSEKGEIKIKLTVRPYGENLEKHAYETAKLVRSIILRWRSEVEG